jgi:hypothetical protein
MDTDKILNLPTMRPHNGKAGAKNKKPLRFRAAA